MTDPELATTEQIAAELDKRPNEDFIFLFKHLGDWQCHFNHEKDWYASLIR